jgi:hypothetical protein
MCFASELRALLASGLLGTPRLDPQSVASCVWNGFVVGPGSAVQGVELLSPGRLLEFANQSAMLEISGMERYLPIVRRLGIESLKDLKRADPRELHARVVDAVGLAGAPSLSMVEYWIGQARTCDTVEEPGAVPPAQQESPALLSTPPAAARRIG